MSDHENQLTRQCWNLIKLCKGTPNRRNNTAVYDPKKKVYRKFSDYSIKGLGDFEVWWPNGKYWMIEFKTETEELSNDQKKVKADLESKSHTHLTIRHINELIAVLRKKGLLE